MADDAGQFGVRTREIGVTEFKAKALGLIADVQTGRLTEVRLTKRGKVVARLTAEPAAPAKPEKRVTLDDIAEAMKGMISIPDDVDLTEPTTTDEEWEEQLDSMSRFLTDR